MIPPVEPIESLEEYREERRKRDAFFKSLRKIYVEHIRDSDKSFDDYLAETYSIKTMLDPLGNIYPGYSIVDPIKHTFFLLKFQES